MIPYPKDLWFTYKLVSTWGQVIGTVMPQHKELGSKGGGNAPWKHHKGYFSRECKRNWWSYQYNHQLIASLSLFTFIALTEDMWICSWFLKHYYAPTVPGIELITFRLVEVNKIMKYYKASWVILVWNLESLRHLDNIFTREFSNFGARTYE